MTCWHHFDILMTFDTLLLKFWCNFDKMLTQFWHSHLNEILSFTRDIVICPRYSQLPSPLVYLFTLSIFCFKVKFGWLTKYLLPKELGVSNYGFILIPVVLILCILIGLEPGMTKWERSKKHLLNSPYLSQLIESNFSVAKYLFEW